MSIMNRDAVRWKLLPGMVLLLLACAGTALCQGQPAGAPNSMDVKPDEVVLTIGDKTFTAAEFEKIISALPPQFQATLASLGKKGFAEQFGSLMGLAMEGEKRQLDQGEAFQQMLEFERRVLLAQVTMNAVATESSTVGAEEVSYYYQTHSQDFEQVRVTGIYVSFAPPSRSSHGGVQTFSAIPAYTEQQAERKALELRVRIQSGQDMATLAKTESDHPTAAKGGDFGYLGRNQTQLPAKIVAAIFSLQPHQITPPLKQGSGFFIFRVEDKRVQPLEEVQQSIQASLGIQKMNRKLEILKESYPVELNPNYFTDAPETSPAPPAGGR
jgi:PPIC-type PPIASE domain